MISIIYYRDVTNGEDLAAKANVVLGNYVNNRAKVVRTDSVPATKEKPAEHLIVVLFPRPDFIEAVFARFKIVGGVGAMAIYAHREYGKKSAEQMNVWLQTDGASTEKALMRWDQIPPLDVKKK
jgi:hypothetical protein